MKKTIWLFVITGFGFTSLSAKVLFVNQSASGLNNGDSWANAFLFLDQALISATNGDEIWVSQGIYTPKLPASTPYFEISKNIKIFGSFRGDETQINQRAIGLYPSILMAKPNTVSTVIYCHDTDTTARLDGFIITGGTISAGGASGGGIALISSDPDNPVFLNIVHCTFSDNKAPTGGAIGLQCTTGSGGINIDSCTFELNRAGTDGGAIFIETGLDPQYPITISNSVFHNNFAGTTAGAIAYGNFNIDGVFKLDACSFFDNEAIISYGALGYFSASQNKGVISNCLFNNNKCGTDVAVGGAGGAVAGDRIQYTNCSFLKNQAYRAGAIAGKNNEYVNCFFSKNAATKYGGAIGFLSNNPELSISKIINCTFYKNYAGDNGGVLESFRWGRDTIMNSVFYDNLAGVEGNLIFSRYGNLHVFFDNVMWDIQDCASALLSSGSNPGTDTISCGEHMISIIESPFVDTLEEDFHLRGCSAGINFANPDFLSPFGVIRDIWGDDRILGLYPDVGAFEQDEFTVDAQFVVTNESVTGLDGSIELNALSGNAPPYLFDWNTGSKDSSLYYLSQGTYTITITDFEGCDTTVTFVINKQVGISESESIDRFVSVFPTVARTGTPVNVKTENRYEQNIRWQLFTLDGKLIMQNQSHIQNGFCTLEIGDSQAGNYVLLLYMDNHAHQAVHLVRL